MIINGREVKFRYTVGAELQLKKHYEGQTAEALGEAYKDSPEKAFDDMCAMLLILNKAAVVKAEFESGKPIALHDYSSCLTREEIENLTEAELNQLTEEMLAAKNSDGEITVEAESEKKTSAPTLN